jgi:hypothetical protein
MKRALFCSAAQLHIFNKYDFFAVFFLGGRWGRGQVVKNQEGELL